MFYQLPMIYGLLIEARIVKKLFLVIGFLFVIHIAYGQLINHGVVAPVSEGRGLIAHRTSKGEPIIITVAADHTKEGPRSSLLIIDARTGKTDQYWHPHDGENGENKVSRECFASMLASNGKFYTMFGDVFLEFDLNKREWTFSKKIEGMAMSFAEGANGTIFFANYPKSTLYSFDPKSREFRSYGRLDNVEKYPFSLAVGADDWVYAGIGTAKNNLVAFNTRTNIRIGLIGEQERELGEGYVFLAEDGVIYATHDKKQKSPLFRLENGQKIREQNSLASFPKRAITGFIFWQHRVNDFPGGGKIQDFVLRDKRSRLMDENGLVYNITFDYKTNGAGITSMTLGPDGAVWGSTAHSFRLWRYDPLKDSKGNWNGIDEIPGGNFPNLVSSDKHLYGALYNGGMVWRFDTSKPGKKSVNPSQLGAFKEIARPRSATSTSDGKNIVFGGYAGYGLVGGDLVFVNTSTNEATLVKIQDQIPGLSTIAMRSLPGGLLVGGTSTAAPGGGTPAVSKAVLYLMDDNTRKIVFQTVPVSSGRDIESLEYRNGLVYGITSDSRFFIFDPQNKKVTLQKDLSEYGSPTRPGQSLILANDGNIYGIFSRNIFKIDDSHIISKLVDLPENATSGIAYHNNRLYFGCGSNIWSYKIK